MMAPTRVRLAARVPHPAARGFAAAVMTGNHMDEDLMTRRQVACLFRVTSAAVGAWARRGRLPEGRNEAGRPRRPRAGVEAPLRGGLGGGGRWPRHTARVVTAPRCAGPDDHPDEP